MPSAKEILSEEWVRGRLAVFGPLLDEPILARGWAEVMHGFRQMGRSYASPQEVARHFAVLYSDGRTLHLKGPRHRLSRAHFNRAADWLGLDKETEEFVDDSMHNRDTRRVEDQLLER